MHINVKYKTINILGKKPIEEILWDLRQGKGFLDVRTTYKMKKYKLHFIKI